MELFTTQGYHASTTPQIAARAGVAEGTIYRHFQSKEHLLNEIYRAAVRLFLDHVKETPAAMAPQQRLNEIAERWRQLAVKDPAIVSVVFGRRWGDLLDAKSREAWAQFKDELGKVVAAGKAAGTVRAGPVDLWADVWLQLVILVLQRVAMREWPPPHPAPQQVLDAAWDAIKRVDG